MNTVDEFDRHHTKGTKHLLDLRITLSLFLIDGKVTSPLFLINLLQ